MGTALRRVVAASKAQKDSISGRGKLTQEKMAKMQNYYGRAIKDHADDIPLLKKRIMAIILHLSSTDQSPKQHASLAWVQISKLCFVRHSVWSQESI